ncbi:MAG: response regulator [Flavobacteriaceae bacterium]|nr:response regulator [Flavobacteriaceae bacterium]
MKNKLNCILLVDDDEGTNFYNEIIIEKASLTNHIEITLNGKEAIEYITYNRVDNEDIIIHPKPVLILLDINMPVMDGWEFLEVYQDLKAKHKDKTIIVMLTTSSNPDDRTRAASILDVADFKNKPLSVKILNEIMEKHFADYL